MIKERIKKMGHYKPPLEGRSVRNYLLLDFNERTVEPSQKVKEALKKIIDSKRLQVYPEYGDLEEKIAQYAEVKDGQVMVTNGADQELMLFAGPISIPGIKRLSLSLLLPCITRQLGFKELRF